MSHTGTDPLARGHPRHLVVIAQLTVPGAQLIARGHLLRVVEVTVARGELMDGHHAHEHSKNGSRIPPRLLSARGVTSEWSLVSERGTSEMA